MYGGKSLYEGTNLETSRYGDVFPMSLALLRSSWLQWEAWNECDEDVLHDARCGLIAEQKVFDLCVCIELLECDVQARPIEVHVSVENNISYIH